MTLLEHLKSIPIINDHTHIFGTGHPDDYEQPGRYAAELNPLKLVASLSAINMNETSTMTLRDDPDGLHRRLIELYDGRRTTFPARAVTRFLCEAFDWEGDEITLDNAHELVERMRRELPVGTDALYAHMSRLTNTELWFCNHGNLACPERNLSGTTRGWFRWVPYTFGDVSRLNEVANKLGFERPQTENAVREVMVAALQEAKALGAVAIKGGAFAYNLNRPFAPDVEHLECLEPTKRKLDLGTADPGDAIAFTDALTVITCQAAGAVGLPVQIHVGLIWSARGPTRIPEIMDLTPLFHTCRETTFVIFHGAYPRTDDLAHVAATMSNVRAEFNWVPFWSGMDFAGLIGKWIDMIPNDRILYGTDAGGFAVSSTHDVITRQGLSEALALRVQRGYLSQRVAREIAADILRNNAIDTYGLGLDKYRP